MKKSNVLPIKLAIFSVGLSLTLSGPSSAATVFEANFDGPPYDTVSEFGTLPTGSGVLTHGSWSNISSGEAWALTTNEQSYSSPNSLVLDRLGASGVGNAQVVGLLGYNNAPEMIESALSFSMAFRVTDNSADNLVALSFADSTGNNVTYAYLSMNGSLQIPVGPSLDLLSVGAIDINQWYVIEVMLPSASGSEYTFNLFGSDGITLLGSQTAETLRSPVGGYWYFTVGSSLADSAIYIDDIVVQAVPEPGALGLYALGAFLGVALWRKKNREA